MRVVITEVVPCQRLGSLPFRLTGKVKEKINVNSNIVVSLSGCVEEKSLGQDHWLGGVTRRRFAPADPSPFIHISFTASEWDSQMLPKPRIFWYFVVSIYCLKQDWQLFHSSAMLASLKLVLLFPRASRAFSILKKNPRAKVSACT